MNALDWLRSKAQQVNVEVLTLEDGRKFKSTFYSFKGRIQPRMVFELQRLRSDLKNESNVVYETLRTAGQYRSEFGNCEYGRFEYEQVA